MARSHKDNTLPAIFWGNGHINVCGQHYNVALIQHSFTGLDLVYAACGFGVLGSRVRGEGL